MIISSQDYRSNRTFWLPHTEKDQPNVGREKRQSYTNDA